MSELASEDNYWGNPIKEPANTKRKKVSFDDILSNMNLVVNQQGVLQHMALIEQEPCQPQQQQQQQQQEQPQNYYQQQSQQQQQQQQQSQQQPNSSNNNYIYNKYFKDFKAQNEEQPVIRVPKTMEEYKQMLLDDRIKAIQQKHRIDQIKSKKMMFISSPDTINNSRNIQSTKNTLKTMSFH